MTDYERWLRDTKALLGSKVAENNEAAWEGMRHAARQGARIGRPLATARPGFAGRWLRVQAELVIGTVSRPEEARRLGIGTATLGRLLADQQKESSAAAAAVPHRVAAVPDGGPTPSPLASALRPASRKARMPAEHAARTPGARSGAARATRRRGSRHG